VVVATVVEVEVVSGAVVVVAMVEVLEVLDVAGRLVVSPATASGFARRR
jgi:hypothetical protein